MADRERLAAQGRKGKGSRDIASERRARAPGADEPSLAEPEVPEDILPETTAPTTLSPVERAAQVAMSPRGETYGEGEGAFRIVNGEAGYVYKQYAEGRIEIAYAPEPHGHTIGDVVKPGHSSHDAILEEIGEFPGAEGAEAVDSRFAAGDAAMEGEAYEEPGPPIEAPTELPDETQSEPLLPDEEPYGEGSPLEGSGYDLSDKYKPKGSYNPPYK